LFASSFRLFVVAVAVKKCPLPKRCLSAPDERGSVLRIVALVSVVVK